MRHYSTAVVLAAAVAAPGVLADLCAAGSQEINGNWYCQAVNRITYTNFAGQGTYNKITNMDSQTGSCSSTPFAYSGALAPLDEEVSMHFRGPLQLKQFAVYTPNAATPSASSSKAKRSIHQRRHGHHQFHERNKEARELKEQAAAAKRAVGDSVTATIDGQVVSWINEWDGSGVATPTPAPAAATAAAASPASNSALDPAATGAGFIGQAPSSSDDSQDPAPTNAGASPAETGDWSQIAYYNSDDGTANGITFLNNMGGQGSGVFDLTFGNSLAYASADATTGSEGPEVLNSTLKSNSEIIIMSDKECTDGSCGYTRDGTVAYHGFNGPAKAFFFEFSMPNDGTFGWNMNMPAVWMLNAQIPRTLQYGKADCSCWISGCGEFDIMEVLDSGNDRCKSTLHSNLMGGDSDFIQRPTSGFMKLAVLMKDEVIHIQVLDDDFVFNGTIPQATMSSLAGERSQDASVFRLVQ